MAALEIQKRDAVGTRQVRLLRQQGLVPAVIYGHGEANVNVSLQAHDVELMVLHGERLLECDLAGERHNLLIKEVQYDPLGMHILHVDLTRVNLDERVEVTVPVELRGTPAGVEKENGVLTQHLPELTVECVVTAIPEQVRVPVGGLGVGESLRVADLELPEGVSALIDPETVVASVSVVAEEEEAPVAAEEAVEAAEPEVIGEQAEAEEAPDRQE